MFERDRGIIPQDQMGVSEAARLLLASNSKYPETNPEAAVVIGKVIGLAATMGFTTQEIIKHNPQYSTIKETMIVCFSASEKNYKATVISEKGNADDHPKLELKVFDIDNPDVVFTSVRCIASKHDPYDKTQMISVPVEKTEINVQPFKNPPEIPDTDAFINAISIARPNKELTKNSYEEFIAENPDANDILLDTGYKLTRQTRHQNGF